MNSINFPNIFNGSTTYVASGSQQAMINLKLLLLSERGSLFGDPAFGCNLRKLIFEQNTNITADLLIDEIYTAIGYFLPQLIVKRNDIKIYKTEDNYFYATVNAINKTDYTNNLYTIKLM